MSKSQQVSDAIVKQGMLPLYFNADEATSIDTMRALNSAGITALEYTNRGDAALANLKKWWKCVMRKYPVCYLVLVP